MKINIKILFISLIFIIFFCVANTCYAANLSVNVNFDGNNIEMTSETPEMTWNINNILPGETDETILTINNIGKKIVDISFLAKVVSGEDVADILDVKIIKLANETHKKDDEFFNGKYSKLVSMGLTLEGGKSQSYKIITTLPKETGNEFQNKECNVKLTFRATGIEDEKPGKPNDKPENVVTDVIKPVQTGESKTIYIVATVLVIALLVLVFTFYIVKSKNKNN